MPCSTLCRTVCRTPFLPSVPPQIESAGGVFPEMFSLEGKRGNTLHRAIEDRAIEDRAIEDLGYRTQHFLFKLFNTVKTAEN
ncbi:MAG: hypothetical protein RLZZ435_3434 [Cyanobacteriota bacterium]